MTHTNIQERRLNQSSCTPQVLLITPWNRDGGLATYSKYLFDSLSNNSDIEIYPWDEENTIKRGIGIGLINRDFLRKILSTDVVHVQYTFGRYLLSILFIALFCRILGTPIVITQHERFDNLPFSKLVYAWHQLLYFLIDRIIVHTEYRKALSSRIHHKSFQVIPHGVIHRENIESTPSEISTILIPGIVREIKGHDKLVSSLRLLPDNISLRIVGTSTDEEYSYIIESTIEEHGLSDRVDWIDRFISEEELYEEIRNSDLVVLPYQEHTSMSGILAHCISWKTPTLITNCPSFRCVVSEDNAFLDSRTSSGIAKSIDRLRDLDHQEAVIREFTTLSKEYSWDHVSQLTSAIYMELIDS